ncbi:MAG TPA: hypothetical protein PKY10_11520 [Lentisphaeria bacterium]|nr:hypothetical protein [Lentisphaeria bacterium]
MKMIYRHGFLVVFAVGMIVAAGCTTTYSVDRVHTAGEDSLVFVRPDRYSLLGTRSLREHIEITYETLTYDQATGYAIVRVGVRNRGEQHFWKRRGRDINLAAQAAFYHQPVALAPPQFGASFPSDVKGRQQAGGPGVSAPPVHQSARKTFALPRGQTYHLEFICPVSNVSGYQVVFSEY